MTYVRSLFFLFFVFEVLLLCAASVRGNTELKALMELKAALDPDGRLLASWDGGDGDHCSGRFVGVACDARGEVANISLQGFGLSGTISPVVARLRRLSGLYLHYNAIHGEIPSEISSLADLSELYLNSNKLTGSIPVEIGNISGLQVLQLCCNKLTGSIPNQVGLLGRLTFLALQHNDLTGAIPAAIGELTWLMWLDLSFNKLFGSIPVELAKVSSLVVLDLRNNSLSGNVPSGLKRLSDGFKYGNNPNLCGVGFSTLRDCNSEPLATDPAGLMAPGIPKAANIVVNCSQTHCHELRRPSAAIVIASIAAVVFGVMVLGLAVFSWHRRRKHPIVGSMAAASEDDRIGSENPKDANRRCPSPLIGLEHSNGWDPLSDEINGNGLDISQSFRFNFEEVECATRYFSEVNLLGKSGFDSTFKGVLRDGALVAVKSINSMSCRAEDAEFLKGLKMLTLLRHENLVALKGFCCSRGRGECYLVYDFVGNGKLSRFLDAKGGGHGVLDWPTRVSIIKGIAKGLEYLHSNKSKPPVIHQNLSADKVLLDHDFKPLISGSGVHKLLADDIFYSTLKASAAMGYLPPEYATTVGGFTEKSDVYAFGVLVLQVLGGKTRDTHRMLDAARSKKLGDLIDDSLKGSFSDAEAARLSGIAVLCTDEAPSQRPTMQAVVQELFL